MDSITLPQITKSFGRTQVGPDPFVHVQDTGPMERMTARITGDMKARHGDTVHPAAGRDQLRRFGARGPGFA